MSDREIMNAKNFFGQDKPEVKKDKFVQSVKEKFEERS